MAAEVEEVGERRSVPADVGVEERALGLLSYRVQSHVPPGVEQRLAEVGLADAIAAIHQCVLYDAALKGACVEPIVPRTREVEADLALEAPVSLDAEPLEHGSSSTIFRKKLTARVYYMGTRAWRRTSKSDARPDYVEGGSDNRSTEREK